MNTYTFTKISGNTSTKQGMPDGMVSLSKTGRIGLGKQFVDRHGLDDSSRAYLYWDDKHKAVAFTFKVDSASRAENGNYVKVQPGDGYTVVFIKGEAGYIVPGSFFKKIGLDPSEHAGFYRYEVLKARDAGITDVNSEVFVINLQGDQSD